LHRKVVGISHGSAASEFVEMHVAIIMNGNARWAVKRGLPPTAAYLEGAAALRTTVALSLRAGVKTLTLYAIGCTGTDSPTRELDADLRVLRGYLCAESRRCAAQAVRISVIGNCKRPLLWLAEDDEFAAATHSRLHLRIVIDYSAHDRIVQSSWCDAHPQAPENFARRLRELDQTALPAGAVDLLIRTGGPQDPWASGKCRSDYMLWEVAYARLHYADCLWPDFSAHHFQRALGCGAAGDLPGRSMGQPVAKTS
jgi:undecaprenyl diphosphate synthase